MMDTPDIPTTFVPLPSGTRRKGFASMTPERRREIASRGGKAAQALGSCYKFTVDTAAAAGSAGGKAKARNRAAVKAAS